MAFQPQGDGKVSVQLVSRCIISGQTAMAYLTVTSHLMKKAQSDIFSQTT